jgi:hypothetical protein
LDPNYVKQFLNEINEIDAINVRSDKFIGEKSEQTFMKYGDQRQRQMHLELATGGNVNYRNLPPIFSVDQTLSAQ